MLNRSQESAVRMYESIERPLRGEANFDKSFDLTLEQTANNIQVRLQQGDQMGGHALCLFIFLDPRRPRRSLCVDS
jgi:hypothetical protein